MRILIVEDDVLLARHYQRVLRAADYETRHAEHAIAAIEHVDDFKPDILVVDMLLTGSTIMPLLHELRSHDDLARIPIVMVTNMAEHTELDVLRPYGVRRLLDKSTMQPDDLTAAVRSLSL